MSERFNRAINKVLDQEGGYADHPNDSGGATKWGITLKFYRSYVDSEGTKEDIKNLERGDAKEIYKDFFWNPAENVVDGYSYEDLPAPVGEVILGYSINMGWSRGHKILQESIKFYGIDIEKDGWLGEETVKGAKKIDVSDLVKMISIKASKFYNEIIMNDESQKVFLEGWMRRVIETHELGFKLLVKDFVDDL